jgi:hypothetical protein
MALLAPNASWSLPAHLLEVSEWSANRGRCYDPGSCTNAVQSPNMPPQRFQPGSATRPLYARIDLNYLCTRTVCPGRKERSPEPR